MVVAKSMKSGAAILPRINQNLIVMIESATTTKAVVDYLHSKIATTSRKNAAQLFRRQISCGPSLPKKKDYYRSPHSLIAKVKKSMPLNETMALLKIGHFSIRANLNSIFLTCLQNVVTDQ